MLYLFSLVLVCSSAFLNMAFAKPSSCRIYYLYEDHRLGSPLLDVKIRQHSKTLLIDTGAAHFEVTLPESFLEKHAIKTSQIMRSKNLDGKIFQSYLWRLPKIIFGKTLIKNVLASASNMVGVEIGKQPTKTKPIDGIIGLKAFEGRKILFDFKKNLLSFVDHFDMEKASQKWISFDENFKFNININNKSYLATLDTGSNISFANSKNIDLKKMKTLNSFQEISGDKLYFFEPAFFQTFFKPTNENWRIFFYDLSQADVDIIVGMDVLLEKRLLIDMVNHQFCLTERSG